MSSDFAILLFFTVSFNILLFVPVQTKNKSIKLKRNKLTELENKLSELESS